MTEAQNPTCRPDLAQGVSIERLYGKTLLGHCRDQDVLLVRSAAEMLPSTPIAVTIIRRSRRGLWSAKSIPLPLHHGLLRLRTGEADGVPGAESLAVARSTHRAIASGRPAQSASSPSRVARHPPCARQDRDRPATARRL